MTQPDGTEAAIDVSAAQSANIDWDTVAASGVTTVFVEIGVGNDTPNPDRASQVSGALAAGLTVIPYDFAFALPTDGVHANRDPVAQAQLFLKEAANLGLDPQQPIVLDAEFPKETDFKTWGESASLVRAWLLACLAELERATGVTPWLYASPGYLQAIGCDQEPSLSRYKLWVAQWGVSAPTVPAPWQDFGCWQYSPKGSVPGITGAVDLSWIRV